MYIDYSVLLKLWEDIFNGFFNKNTFPSNRYTSTTSHTYGRKSYFWWERMPRLCGYTVASCREVSGTNLRAGTKFSDGFN